MNTIQPTPAISFSITPPLWTGHSMVNHANPGTHRKCISPEKLGGWDDLVTAVGWILKKSMGQKVPEFAPSVDFRPVFPFCSQFCPSLPPLYPPLPMPVYVRDVYDDRSEEASCRWRSWSPGPYCLRPPHRIPTLCFRPNEACHPSYEPGGNAFPNIRWKKV